MYPGPEGAGGQAPSVGCAWNGRTGTLVLGVGCLERPRSGLPHVTDCESSCLEVEESMDAAHCRHTVSKIIYRMHGLGKISSKKKKVNKTNKTPSNGSK